MLKRVETESAFSASGSPPAIVQMGDSFAPETPSGLKDIGIDTAILTDLALKLAHAVPHLTTEIVVQRLCLPLPMVTEVLDRLVKDKQIEILGQVGPLNRRLSITEKGRERARWLLDVSGYVGPAPVSLEAYAAILEWQAGHLPKVSPEQVGAALEDLVLPEQALEVAGLAVSSGRSLFLYGPPGNGKTSVARMLHRALEGSLWIPHCIGVESRVIQVFDPRFHKVVSGSVGTDLTSRIDRRWLKVQRPLIVAGGEVTLDDLELAYDPATHTYALPVHLKANGGVFLLDDFGCQPVEPHRLLNRWIVPLENQVDHLTLRTGQKVEVPFLQMLVLSTNLDPDVVMTPALLRRMGYRLHLGDPSAKRFSKIFQRYAAKYSVEIPSALLERLIEKHRREGYPLRGCTPRDLIERCRDICHFKGRSLEISQETLDLAWNSYFGQKKDA